MWRTYFTDLFPHNIGPAWNDVGPVFGSDDEMILAVSNPSGWSLPHKTNVLVHASGGTRPTVFDPDYPINSVGVVASIPADGYLCTTGAVSGTGCHTFVGTTGPWFGVLNVRSSDGENVCEGDSGGPVFAQLKGYGIIQGGQPNDFVQYETRTFGTQNYICTSGQDVYNLVYYVSLSRAMSQLNVQLSP